jgi:hypothetical protein
MPTMRAERVIGSCPTFGDQAGDDRGRRIVRALRLCPGSGRPRLACLNDRFAVEPQARAHLLRQGLPKGAYQRPPRVQRPLKIRQ